MRIFIFGNINSGKTTLLDVLKIRYTQYSILRIDDFRRKYGKGDYESDLYAQDMFVQAVIGHENALVEATGLGPLGQRLKEAFNGFFGVILYVDTPIALCLERIDPEKFMNTPYPVFSETLENTIKRCGTEFQKGDLVSLWGMKITQHFTIKGDLNFKHQLKEIPLELLLHFEQLVAVLDTIDKIQSLFTFGSMARGELTFNSDIDVFAVTELTASEMGDYLKQEMKIKTLFTDTIRNKLTLRFEGNLLIEINCIRNIEEVALFYREAKIKNVSQSLYIGVPADIQVLEEFSRETVDEKRLVEEFISEIFYYICSLPAIMDTKDEYKFYFHGNIILHNFVRIKAILSGVKDKNYLPVQSKEFLSEGYSVLFPPHAGNLQNYIDDTKTCFRECLSEVETAFDIDTSKYSDFPL